MVTGPWRALRQVASATCILLFSACGGGGGDGSGSGQATAPTPSPAPAGVSVSFLNTNLETTASAEQPAQFGLAATYRLSVPVQDLYYRIVPQGVGVSGGQLNFDRGVLQGAITLSVQPVAILGAGVYSSTVRVELCHDPACSQPLAGSPGILNVKYTVTSPARPQTRLVQAMTGFVRTSVGSSNTQPGSASLSFIVGNFPLVGGLWFRLVPTGGTLLTGFDATPVNTGGAATDLRGLNVQLDLRSGKELGSGIFEEEVEFQTCFDSSCGAEVSDSRQRVRIQIRVSATEGIEYSRRVIEPPNGAAALTWSATQQRIYVVSSRTPLPDARASVLSIDPFTGQTSTSPEFPGEYFGALGLLEGANRLCVGSPVSPQVRCLRLPTLTPEFLFSLGPSPQGGTAQILPVPGSPDRLILTTIATDTSASSVRVYQGATMVSSLATPPGQPGRLADKSSGGWYLPGFYTDPPGPRVVVDELQLSGSVLTRVASRRPNLFDLTSQLAGSRFHGISPTVIDAVTLTQVGTVPLPTLFATESFLADPVRNRLFLLGSTWPRTLLVLELDSLRPRGMLLPLEGIREGSIAPTLATWGSDGLAITDGTNLVVLRGPILSGSTP